MPRGPGVAGKAKAKAKLTPEQKARAKKKALKLKIQAKAAAAAAAAAGVEGAAEATASDGAPGGGVLAIVSPNKRATSGGGALRKKLLLGLGEKSIPEAVSDAKTVLQKADAMIEESIALEKAQAKQAADAQLEFDAAKTEVISAIEKESTAAAKYRELKNNRQVVLQTIDSKRGGLLEAQKKLAMLEVLALNHARMAELEQKRRAATEAAEAAKRHLMEQRQKEKDALEATRQALLEARQKGRGLKRGAEAVEIPSEQGVAEALKADDVD